MENATKAFLIAGSVLVAVLITVFGVKIYSDGAEAGNVSETTSTIKSGIDSKLDKLNTLIYD